MLVATHINHCVQNVTHPKSAFWLCHAESDFGLGLGLRSPSRIGLELGLVLRIRWHWPDLDLDLDFEAQLGIGLGLGLGLGLRGPTRIGLELGLGLRSPTRNWTWTSGPENRTLVKSAAAESDFGFGLGLRALPCVQQSLHWCFCRPCWQ